MNKSLETLIYQKESQTRVPARAALHVKREATEYIKNVYGNQERRRQLLHIENQRRFIDYADATMEQKLKAYDRLRQQFNLM